MAKVANFIEKLRAQPEPFRQQIVVWTALVLTVSLFFFWLSGLTPETKTAAELAAAAKVEQSPNPFRQIMNGGKIFYEKVR